MMILMFILNGLCRDSEFIFKTTTIQHELSQKAQISPFNRKPPPSPFNRATPALPVDSSWSASQTSVQIQGQIACSLTVAV
jgi:hypothetical protein